MPRDIHIAAPRPIELADLVAAAAEINGSLAVRALFYGTVLQLVGVDDVAVLTIQSGRRLLDTSDVNRVDPKMKITEGELWWTEATAPWSAAGAQGVAIARVLALIVGGSVRVEDGKW